MAAPSDAYPKQDSLDTQSEVVETISELDIAIQALLSDLPSVKPWQRRFRLKMAHAARCAHVLRMSVVMASSNDDTREAARRVQQALLVAHASIASGRADPGTRTMVNVAIAASQRISKALC